VANVLLFDDDTIRVAGRVTRTQAFRAKTCYTQLTIFRRHIKLATTINSGCERVGGAVGPLYIVEVEDESARHARLRILFAPMRKAFSLSDQGPPLK
jgi:hypothetical protein